MSCEVERFGEIVDNLKENLKYLQQLEKTYNAQKEGEEGKFRALLVESTGGLFEDAIKDLFQNGVSFDALIGGMQFLALANPSAMGVALSREVNTLETYFREEKQRIESVVSRIQMLVANLSDGGIWSGLSDYPYFLANHRKGLNNYYNLQVSKSIFHINTGKVNLLTAENMLYQTHVLQDDTSFIQQLQSAKHNFAAAKNVLFTAEGQNLLDILGDFQFHWNDLLNSVKSLTDVNGIDWSRMRDEFSDVGTNLIQFLEGLRAAIGAVSTSIYEADGLIFSMQDAWELTHEPIVKNQSKQNQYRLYAPVWNAINTYISTGVPVRPIIPDPEIGLPVSIETLLPWEAQANAHKPLQTLWYNRLERLEMILGEITTGQTASTLSGIDTILSPLTSAIIDTYEAASRPFWRELLRLLNVGQNIIFRMMQGQAVESDIAALVVQIQTQVQGISQAASNMVAYFDTQKPAQSLLSLFGITQHTQALFGGFSALADSLGFDFLSKLVKKGDFVGVLGLTEKSANMNQQLLDCLKKAKTATGETPTAGYQGAALEIQKVATAEKLRQTKLRKTFNSSIRDGVAYQEEEIKRYEGLLKRYEEGP